jgi:hypothetical protein
LLGLNLRRRHSAAVPCAGADRLGQTVPQTKRAPAASLESWGDQSARTRFPHLYMSAGRCRDGVRGAHSRRWTRARARIHLTWARQPVSLRAGVTTAGPLLFHRAIRTVEIGGAADSGVSAYARFTQRLLGFPTIVAHAA